MGATCTQAEEEENKGPLRWAPFPEPPESGQTAYGRRNPELGRVDALERTEIYLRSVAWQTIAKPILDALDRERDPRGRKLVWTAEDKERILFYGVMAGFEVTQIPKILDSLRGKLRDRAALGFQTPRQGRLGRPIPIDGFLPSAGTLRAHLRKIDVDRRAAMYEAVEQALVDEYLAIPEVRETKLRQFYLDGFDVRTRKTAPVYRKQKGRKVLVNEERITAPDAGYRGSAPSKEGGKGWLGASISNPDGVCAARVRGKITEEIRCADEAIDLFRKRVTPIIPEDEFAVLTMDRLHNRPKIRFKCRDAGLIENVHFVSHKQTSKARAAAHTNKRYPLDHPSKPAYKNWFLNGHRELVCSCDDGRVECEAKRRSGKISLTAIGRCNKCGSVRVKSGRWRLAKNPARFVLCQPDEYDRADLAAGNILTFNDPRAKIYGTGRFGHQEGGFGALRNLGLPKFTDFSSGRQVDVTLAMRHGALDALAIEKYRRASRAGPAPPGRAAA